MTEPDPADEREAEGEQARSTLRARASAWTTATTSRLQERRATSRTIDAAFLSIARNRVLPISVLAGALVSRIVLFLTPLLALLIVGVGFYSDFSGETVNEAARDAGMAGIFAQAAGDVSNAQTAWRAGGFLVTILATLWAAMALVRTLRRVFAFIWRVRLPRQRRPWLTPFAVLGAAAISLAFSAAFDFGSGPSTVVLSTALQLAAVAAFWLGVSLLMPHDPGAGWLDMVPGALLTALSVAALQVATVVYLAPKTESLAARYGSLATVLVMLVWAYLIGLAVVASAELNAVLYRSSHPAAESASDVTDLWPVDL